MGCGASRSARRRRHGTYHGVAYCVTTPSRSGGGASSLVTPRTLNAKSTGSSYAVDDTQQHLSETESLSDYESPMYDYEEVQLRQERRRHRTRRWEALHRFRTATGSCRGDALMHFGQFHLRFVDELAVGCSRERLEPTSVVANPQRESGADCLSTTRNFGVRYCRRCCGSSSGCTKNAGQGSCCTGFQRSTSASAPRRYRRRRIRQYALTTVGAGHPRCVKWILLSPDGQLVFSCAWDSATVLVHHLGLDGEVGRLVGHDDAVLGGHVSDDGRFVATASRDATAVVWDTASRKMRLSLPHPKVVFGCRFDPTAAFLVTACQDGLCREWSVETGLEVRSFSECSGSLVYALCYTTDGRRVLSGGSERRVAVWNTVRRNPDTNGCAMEPGTCSVSAFAGHVGALMSIETRSRPPSEGGGELVVSADERLVLVWDLDTLSRVARFDAAGVADPLATRRVHWTACCFGPTSFEGHLLLLTSDRGLRVVSYEREAALAESSIWPSTTATVTTISTMVASCPGCDDRPVLRRPRRTGVSAAGSGTGTVSTSVHREPRPPQAFDERTAGSASATTAATASGAAAVLLQKPRASRRGHAAAREADDDVLSLCLRSTPTTLCAFHGTVPPPFGTSHEDQCRAEHADGAAPVNTTGLSLPDGVGAFSSTSSVYTDAGSTRRGSLSDSAATTCNAAPGLVAIGDAFGNIYLLRLS